MIKKGDLDRKPKRTTRERGTVARKRGLGTIFGMKKKEKEKKGVRSRT